RFEANLRGWQRASNTKITAIFQWVGGRRRTNANIGMAEREGFEPPIGLHLCRISSAVHSTTLPPLQAQIRATHALQVGASSRRGRRGRQGGPDAKGWQISTRMPAIKSGTARRGKHRRSRVASLKLRAGSAASLARL